MLRIWLLPFCIASCILINALDKEQLKKEYVQMRSNLITTICDHYVLPKPETAGEEKIIIQDFKKLVNQEQKKYKADLCKSIILNLFLYSMSCELKIDFNPNVRKISLIGIGIWLADALLIARDCSYCNRYKYWPDFCNKLEALEKEIDQAK